MEDNIVSFSIKIKFSPRVKIKVQKIAGLNVQISIFDRPFSLRFLSTMCFEYLLVRNLRTFNQILYKYFHKLELVIAII